ncbi:MAG: N-acetylmuramoyl-L-alanine amidase [Myxococcota bacterium]
MLMVCLLAAWPTAAPWVVLDPGHGGEARGAVRDGIEEADVVLDIAQAAARRLTTLGVQVQLTRNGDHDLSLRDRIDLAHRLNAAAFVSIHVNASSSPKRRGTETYLASVLQTDDFTAALVAREQASAGASTGPSDPVDRILSDLLIESARSASADLGGAIQSRLSGVAGMGPSRGLRQAPFTVLTDAKVPAVLVEAGYVTHPHQRRALARAQTRRALGEALADGVAAFVRREP